MANVDNVNKAFSRFCTCYLIGYVYVLEYEISVTIGNPVLSVSSKRVERGVTP